MMQLLLCINFCKSEFLMQFVMRWRLLCHRKSHIMPIRSKGDVVCSFWFLRARHSDVFNLAIFSYIFEPKIKLGLKCVCISKYYHCEKLPAKNYCYEFLIKSCLKVKKFRNNCNLKIHLPNQTKFKRDT